TILPCGVYEPTITRSACRTERVKRDRSSRRLLYNSSDAPTGFGMSTAHSYHGALFSRNKTRCPRAASARTNPRYVVACPLPHEERIDRPRMTIERCFILSEWEPALFRFADLTRSQFRLLW